MSLCYISYIYLDNVLQLIHKHQKHQTKLKMKKHHGFVKVFAMNSISAVIFLLLILSSAVDVEGSRPLVHKLSSNSNSISKFQIVQAYSGPSRRGVGHALMHLNLSPAPFKISKAYSGPDKGGDGH